MLKLTDTAELLVGNAKPVDYIAVIILSLLLGMLAIWMSVLCMNKKQL